LNGIINKQKDNEFRRGKARKGDEAIFQCGRRIVRGKITRREEGTLEDVLRQDNYKKIVPIANSLEEAIGYLKRFKEKYKEAVSLPKKIERFLCPLMKELHLVKVERNLKSIMPFIKNKKTVEGIYDLRSRILHEGASIGKRKARKALQISSQFLHVLQIVSQNVKFYRDSAHV